MNNCMYLLDRNVVNLIKDVVAGKEPTDVRKQRCVQFLREIDTSMSYISPLLSIIEGEIGLEDSAEQKADCQKKESEALRQFFSVANIDSDHLDTLRDNLAAFTTYRVGQCGARTVFFQQAVKLIATKVSQNKRPAVERDLICAAKFAGLSAGDALLMLCLACLHGNDDARKVIKPHCPNAYNVLNDLNVVLYIGLIKALVDIPMITRFITMDQGLERVLSNIRVAETDLRDVYKLHMKLRYLPELFPELDHAGYCALMTKLTS